jgi:soluble lytic murein transglycosylase
MRSILRPALLTCSLLLLSGAAFAGPGFTSAVRALDEGKGPYGAALAAKTNDTLAQDLYQWLYMSRRPQDFSFSAIASMMDKHPGWPEQEEMQRAAEKHLSGQTASQVQAFYKNREPLSGPGMLAYMKAASATGNTAAQTKLDTWWRKTLLRPEDQMAIYSNFGRALPKESHVARLGMLLNNDYPTSALQLANVMGANYVALVKARMALQGKGGNADAAVRAVPAALQNDPGLLLDRLKWRRKADANDAAIEILNRQPRLSDHDDTEAWWKERQIMVRRMLELRRYEKAYQIAIKHGMPTDAEKAEAEWLSGWIALRFLDQPVVAFKHFNTMFDSVTSPISKARGAYWAGRAAQQAGQPDVAKAWLQVAAKRPQTYYGILANRALPGNLRVAIPRSINAPNDLVAKVRGSGLGRAAKMLLDAGLQGEAYQFLKAINAQSSTPAEAAALAAYTSELGLKPQALRIAKKAAQEKGFFLPQYAYPTLNKNPETGGVEKALVLAVIRQESEYDPSAVSGAGAMGLMQLMPRTAQETAKKIGVSHNTGMLTAQPYHNVRLGSAYLSQLLDRYDGSLPLVLASYNAGSGRVAQWIALNGDPRKDHVDWVDWVELIPFNETRNYVQRVMEGYEIYKVRQ